MSKETKAVLITLLMPLIVALCGWLNAHTSRVQAEHATEEMSDSFQEYIEYVMKQRGCTP